MSSCRTEKFRQFQDMFDLKRHTLLKLCQTRWLSMKSVISRVLEQRRALLAYFQEESKTSAEANSILVKLQHPLNVLYLEFLEHVLPLVTDRNETFQAERPQISILYAEMESMTLEFLRMYIKPEILDKYNVQNMPYKFPGAFSDGSQMYLGAKVMADLAVLRLRDCEKTAFFTNCRNFLIELVDQIYTRFPFHENFIKGLNYVSFVDPINIKTIESIAPAYSYLCQHFENMDVITLDREYRELKLIMKDNRLTSVQEFWKKVSMLRTGNNCLKFPNVLKVVELILTLPHSSAACERAFSTTNNNKTAKRNCLKTSTLSGILSGKSLMQLKGKSCYNYPITPKMISLHNVNMYDFKKKK